MLEAPLLGFSPRVFDDWPGAVCSWLDPPRYWIDEARGLYVGDALPARSDAIGSLVREDASSHLDSLPVVCG